MKCNFYLDRPFNPKIDKELLKKKKKEVKKSEGHFPKKYLNLKPTSIYVFFSPGKIGRIKYRTSIKILAEHWDFNKSRVRPNVPGALELNVQLDNMAADIIKKAYLATEKNKFLSKNDFKSLVAMVVDKTEIADIETELSQLIEEFKSFKKKRVTKGTMKEYKTIFKGFFEFEKKRKKRFSLLDFDKNFYADFEYFLSKEKVNSNNGEVGLRNDTIDKYISTFRVFLRWCHENDYAVHPYTFKKHKSLYKKGSNYKIFALERSEIKKLEDLDLSDNEEWDRIRDLFLFMAYTGQRFSDAIHFDKLDFRNKLWDFVSIKTGKRTQVPFVGYIGHALRILEKYNYVLPKMANQYFNKEIKKIAEKAGITEPYKIIRYKGKKEIEITRRKCDFISSHTGRRTAVTLLLNDQEMKMPQVQQITKHSKIETLMKYFSHTLKSLTESLEKTN